MSNDEDVVDKYYALRDFAQNILGLRILFVVAAHEGQMVGVQLEELSEENKTALEASLAAMATTIRDPHDIDEIKKL